MRTIAFSSDFGLTDPYVGIVHGVIASIEPALQVIDVTHGIPPQDIAAGAVVLYTSLPHFPAGSVHLAVVDPGVGTTRRALCVETAAGFFIGPDNGLFTLVAPAESVRGCWDISDTPIRRPLSATFHGRDLFAPVAAHVARGVPAATLGQPTDPPVPLKDVQLTPVVIGESRGTVMYIDHFGNLITTLVVTPEWHTALRTHGVSAWLEGKMLEPVRTYGEQEAGTLVVLAGSAGLLEVASPGGSAQEMTGARRGVELRVRVSKLA